MKKIVLTLLILPCILYAQITEDLSNKIISAVQNDSALFMGGAGLIQVDELVYVVSVGMVPMDDNQSYFARKRIGKIKAQNAFIKFCKAPSITSEKKTILKEVTVNDKTILLEEYFEYIEENSQSYVRGLLDLGEYINDKEQMMFIIVGRKL